MPPRKTSKMPPPARLEWAMGGLGLLLVLAALAVIAVEAFGAREPARLEARLGEIRPAGDRWLAAVEVRNLGGETAASVEIEGRLGDATAHAVVDYVPAHGEDRVTLVFDADPRAAAVRVAGWSRP